MFKELERIGKKIINNLNIKDMTRKEEIINAAYNEAEVERQLKMHPQVFEQGFVAGAEWADVHPHWNSVEDELPKDSNNVLCKKKRKAMTQEQKTKIEEHYDRLYSIAVGLTPNIPDDIRDTMRAAYVAGADYALDIYCPQWISVEDRRPKLKHKYENTQCSEKVIVTDGKYRTSASWVHNIWAGWYGWFADGDEELIGITHWMPMPQAPTCSEKPNNCEKGGEE